MHTKNKSIRVAWIDNIKLFAIISVMIGHVSATFFSGEPYKDIVHHVLISWSMPLFIFPKIRKLSQWQSQWQKRA